MKNTRKMQLIIVAVCSLFLVCGCFTRIHIPNISPSPDMDRTRSALYEGARIIIHYRDSIILLKETRIANDTVSGKPESNHKLFMYQNTNNVSQYRKNEEGWLNSQIHLYTNDAFSPVNGFAIVTKEKIKRFDFYQTDLKRTIISKTVSWMMLGVSILTIGIVLGIALGSVKESAGSLH